MEVPSLVSPASFRLQRRAMRGGDWVKLSIVVLTAVLAAAFLFAQLGAYYLEVATLGQQRDDVFYRLWFSQRVENQHNTPHEVYEELRQSLSANDLDGALNTLHPADRNRYRDNFSAAHRNNDLPLFSERLTPLTEKIYDDEYTVVYRTEPIPGNDYSSPLEGWSETVEFTLDGSGLWKISSI